MHVRRMTRLTTRMRERDLVKPLATLRLMSFRVPSLLKPLMLLLCWSLLVGSWRFFVLIIKT